MYLNTRYYYSYEMRALMMKAWLDVIAAKTFVHTFALINQAIIEKFHTILFSAKYLKNRQKMLSKD